MSFFTTRVELYGTPSAEDYDKLHLAMGKEGFRRTIALEGKPTYKLPSAEYNRNGELTKVQVLESAKKAAKTCWADFAVLVTKTEESREWYNLKPE